MTVTVSIGLAMFAIVMTPCTVTTQAELDAARARAVAAEAGQVPNCVTRLNLNVSRLPKHCVFLQAAAVARANLAEVSRVAAIRARVRIVTLVLTQAALSSFTVTVVL